MEKGKFSQPRPYRDEDRQIEEAFRQVTEKSAVPRRPIKTLKDVSQVLERNTEDTVMMPAREVIPEQLLEEIPPEPAAPIPEPVEEPIEDTISREIEKSYPAPEPAPENVPVSVPQAPVPFPEIPEEEEDEEFEEDEPAGILESAYAFFQTHRKWVLTGVFAAALVLILTVIAVFTAGISHNEEERILDNVMVAGVNVGGMTRSEAVRAVKQAVGSAYTRQDMVIYIAGTEIRLSPEGTGASLDIEAAVEAAYTYGHTGTEEEREQAALDSLTGNHTIGLLPYLQLDKDFIRQVLENHAGDSGSTLTQPTYGLEGDYPSLSTEDFDPAAAQTLVLTMGTPGVSFDVDAVYDQVLDAYSLYIFEVHVTDVQPAQEPDPVDLQAIYEEYYVAPVNDSINMQTFETIPGSYGYEFDLEAARVQVESAQYGQVIRIPMVFIAPEMLDGEVLFRDILGEYQTRLPGGSSWSTNVKLACQAIDGTVLQPGETFSFNQTVGQPSSSRGYKKAAVATAAGEEEILGGGISQGASTLYCAVLLADLEVVSRSNHDIPVEYVDYGLDAEVSWGGADLKFRNNTNAPIRISAAVSGSYVTIQLLGTDERDYFIKLDHSVTDVAEPSVRYQDFPHNNPEGHLDGDVLRRGRDGCTVKTYKIKYSRSTGKQLSRDYEATSRYPAVDMLVARVAPPETTVPETTVPETTVPETTVPETTVPETTVPETTVPETTVPETTVQETPITETNPEVPQTETQAAGDLPAAA